MEKTENKSEAKYKFFQHKECEMFPCHKTPSLESFNCLFCYCPLYFLGKNCGGNFHYTQNGIKSCQDCSFPHIKENYAAVTQKLKESLRGE